MFKPHLAMTAAAGGSAFHRRPGIASPVPGPVALLPEGDDHADDSLVDEPDGKPDGAPDKGFPDATPLTEMTVEQREAYWKHQARKHEQRAESRKDYDDLKKKADAHDKAVEAAKSEADKAVDAAREEGRKAAGREANEKAAAAILRASLKARGKTDEQVATLVAATNVGAFLTDDDVDTDRVAAYANDIAGPVTGGGRGPGHGQGTRGSSTRATGVSAGADMFEASRKRRTASATS